MHPSRVERIRVANLLAERTAEACSIARTWGKGFLVVQPPGSPSMFDMAAFVRLRRTAAQRTDIKIAQVDTVRSIAVQALHWSTGKLTSRHWRRRYAISPVQGRTHSKAKGGRPQSQGHSAMVRGPIAVLCPLPATPSPLMPASQPSSSATCERTLPLGVLRRQSLSRQGCSTVSCPGMHWAWQDPRQLPKSTVKELQSRVCLGGMAGLTCPSISIRDTQSQEPKFGQCEFPQAPTVVDDLRRGKPSCGFIGEVLAHVRRRWLQLLGKPVTPPLAGPDPDVLEGWSVAVEDWDAQSTLPSWLRHGAPIGIPEEVETAGVVPPCHGVEPLRNPASLFTCLAGW